MSDNQQCGSGPISSELVEVDPSFAEIVEEFVETLGERMDKMAEALEESDFAQLRTLAHQLKGSAGGYGYPILTEKAGYLEQSAVNEEIDSAAQQLQVLKDLVSRVVISPDS